jgi:hypothetical protein
LDAPAACGSRYWRVPDADTNLTTRLTCGCVELRLFPTCHCDPIRDVMQAYAPQKLKRRRPHIRSMLAGYSNRRTETQQ